MKQKLAVLAALVAIAATLLTLKHASAQSGGRPGALGVIYVSSQGLYYDTYTVVDPLPPKGPFQLLEGGVTEFGPGDPGYLGGRWKQPTGDGGYHYFLCPLLPPGRPTP